MTNSAYAKKNNRVDLLYRLVFCATMQLITLVIRFSFFSKPSVLSACTCTFLIHGPFNLVSGTSSTYPKQE